jgi:hypothetical protein
MRQLRRSMIARAVIGCWREPMQSWKRVAPIAVPFLIIVAVTDVGYFFKDVAHARHLVFFYLLPTAFVAMLYGSVLSMIFAIDAYCIDRGKMHGRAGAAVRKKPRSAMDRYRSTVTRLG